MISGKLAILLIAVIGLIGIAAAAVSSNILTRTAIITPPIGLPSANLELSDGQNLLFTGTAPANQFFTARWESTDVSGNHNYVLFIARTDGLTITQQNVLIEFNGIGVIPTPAVLEGVGSALRFATPIDATQSGQLSVSITYNNAGQYTSIEQIVAGS